MKSILQYFIKYRIAGDVLLLLIVILGVTSAYNVQRSQFPRVESREIAIETAYIGASPVEVEQGVTTKIEEEIDGLEGVKKVNSISSENFSSITVEIYSNFKIANVLAEVKNAVDRINTFPAEVEKPIIYKRERTDPAADIMISGDVDLKTLKAYTQKAEQDLLAKEGISKVILTGYPEEEIQIAVKEAALDAYKLTFDDIARAVQGSNLDLTGGNLEMDNTKITIRAENREYFAEQLENIIVQTNTSGTNILLKDVATITNQWADIPQREFYNGKPASKIQIMSRLNEDIILTAEAAKKFIEDFNKEHTVVKAYLLRDGSIGIRQRTELLIENGMQGFVLVLLLLGLFLKPRIAFWVALGIPVAMAGVFIILPMSFVNINMLSLFGLLMVVGILVDDGIVIAENIFQKYEKGMPADEAAVEGTIEVVGSVFSAVLTTCWFFVLFFLIEGQMGDFMSNIGFVVIVTLMFSLLEAFFILPAHIAHSKDLQRSDTTNVLERSTTAFFNFIKNKMYAPALNFCINNKTITLAVAIVALMISVNMVKGGAVKVTFFPNVDQDNILVTLKLPAGTTENITTEILERIEKATWELNEELSKKRDDTMQVVLSVARSISNSPSEGSVFISLLDGEARNLLSSDMSNMLREKVGKVHGVETLTYGQRSFFGAAIQVGFTGDDMNQLRLAKDEFKAILEKDKRLKDVDDNDQKGGLEFHLELLPKAKALGVNLQTIIRQVRQGYFGLEIQRLQRGTDEIKVWLRYTEDQRESFSKFQDTKIRVGTNTYPLKDLVLLTPKRIPLRIAHVNSRPKLEVSASLNDVKASSTEIFNQCKNEILPKILAKYPGVEPVYEGQSERANDTATSMQRWLPIILLLVFFTIVLTFRSFLQATVVMLLIPFAFIGVVMGHWLHDSAISLLSVYGILAVAGIVVNDSLVLIETMNQLLKTGMPFREALVEASVSRFRPIILTSATTIAGLLPIVLEKSIQAQFVIPMALSLAYGLLAATFMTLLVLPSVLVVVNNLKRAWLWLWEGENVTAEDVEPSVIEDKH